MKEFDINHLEELKNEIIKHQIEKQDICIVGSAVLAALNIRSNKDLDIIILHNKRDMIKKTEKNFLISKNIECVSKNWMRKTDKPISDDEIILNPKNHFYKKGFKFCSLELLKIRKKFSTREKDIKDLKEINDRS
tara:strand:- start:354 stop:758 length:405 start_codon:yes stop_codon:yes gene_type:complete